MPSSVLRDCSDVKLIAKHNKHLSDEGIFLQSLNCLFNLANPNMLHLAAQEDIEFLNQQQKPERTGTIGGQDSNALMKATNHASRLDEKARRLESEKVRKEDDTFIVQPNRKEMNISSGSD